MRPKSEGPCSGVGVILWFFPNQTKIHPPGSPCSVIGAPETSRSRVDGFRVKLRLFWRRGSRFAGRGARGEGGMVEGDWGGNKSSSPRKTAANGQSPIIAFDRVPSVAGAFPQDDLRGSANLLRTSANV